MTTVVQGDAGDDLIYGDLMAATFCAVMRVTIPLVAIAGKILRGAVGEDGQQDCINGGSGDDLLYGNEGQDTLNGDSMVMTLFTEEKIAIFSMGVLGMTGCLVMGEMIL
jgi:Ca2+-binding RTX toxin-like protein